MVEVESLYNMGYEQGLKDTLDKYDEIFRIASEIRIAVGCKTAKECWELARNGDIQVVKHGKWIFSPDHAEGTCTRCNYKIYGRPYQNTYMIVHYNYCPNCGSRMDGGDHESD